MAVCPSCGKELPPGEFPFCPFCTAALTETPAPSRERRKTVTVLFCDVTSSTELGEKLDPETLRTLLARYFERMKAIVERHGGTVEKFIGDAVMAAFGVPALHEDDALRALRAAVEMREALPELGVRGRIGVTTGEVVTGTEERLATGDAVNVAARLEQAAQPGEILIGEETYQLTRDAAEVEVVEPLQLKGKSEPVAAYRLLSVHGAEGFTRHPDAPMVGRGREQRQLASVWERVVSERACQLFTILGPAGVGKSRLAAEFLASCEDGLVVRGRCLPYGEGITYWPVVEVLKQLPRTEADPVAAQTIHALVADEQLVTSSEEIAWAFRKQLEAVAAERPLVCVFDDVHWGEETFLDLVEHVADLSRDAPILLLCMARPELLDRRAGWAGGKVNATNVLLEPLGPQETELLIESLAHLDEGLRERIREAAEGNPLFVEEMVALVQESGDGEVTVPPTIQALLAARLDQLDSPERDVLQRGAVEGRLFHRGAVQALAPEEAQVMARLTSLVRKELVRPDKTQFAGDDAFRFRHLLIRDAAYDALPKVTRAELHERFAEWLEEQGATLVELDEILGYHLEQACRYRVELGSVNESGERLARRAAQRLAAGGQTALARRDVRAAAGLLSRAVELLPSGDRARLELMPGLAEVLADTGEFARAVSLLEEAIEGARRSGDDRLRAEASLGQIELTAMTDPSVSAEDSLGRAEEIASIFERLGDEAGLAKACALVGRLHFFRGQAAVAEAAYEQALAHARQAGDFRLEQGCLSWWAGVKRYGPAPAAEAVAFIDNLSERALQDARLAAFAFALSAGLAAMEGRFQEARALIARGRQHNEEFGLRVRGGAHTMEAGYVELLAGDTAAAERQLREGYEILGLLGETGFRSTVGSLLAQALALQGRDDEAERVLDEVEAIAQADDIDPQTRSRIVRAGLLARRGDLVEAEHLAREGLVIIEQTDYLDLHADALLALAAVLQVSQRFDQASAALSEAAELYEQKGNVVSVRKARALLEELSGGSAR